MVFELTRVQLYDTTALLTLTVSLTTAAYDTIYSILSKVNYIFFAFAMILSFIVYSALFYSVIYFHIE